MTNICRAALAAAVLVVSAAPAGAVVITNLSGGTSITLPSDFIDGAGPVVVGDLTFTGEPRVVVGLLPAGQYGFGSNGLISAPARIAATARSEGAFTITFAQAVTGFLAYTNYTREPSFDVSATAFDANGTVIDTILFARTGGANIVQPGDIGFASAAGIKSITYRNGFIGLTNLRVGAAIVPPTVDPAVPEPATWATMMLGFGLVGAAARRRRTAAA